MIFVLNLFFALSALAQPVQVPMGRVEGVVLERGTKRPLSDVNVYILPHKLKSTTDSRGRFIFTNVPMGDFEFVVNAANYKNYSRKENLDLTAAVGRQKILLERATYQGFEITVRDRANKRDDTTRSMKAAQFLNVPGANGDPVKAVQNLPGVARVQGFSSQVIIQGSAPKDTKYLLDDHEVPLIFHFGGLTSVITPEAVEQVDYLSAGYGPEYGRALGGLIGLKTRNPSTERTKGFAFVDITKSGGMIEGPIDETSSYMVAGRYSYLGFVLGQALKDEPAFNLTVAPSFGDLTGIYKKKFSNGDEFKFLSILSHDELKFVLNEPLREDPGLRGEFSNTTDFYRLIPQWERRLSASEAVRASLGFGEDKLKINAGDNFLDVESRVLTQRTEWEKRFRPEWTSYLGLDSRLLHNDVALKLPGLNDAGGVNNPFSSGESVEREITEDNVLIGPYWRNRIKYEDSRWTLMPSLRVDYFSRTKEVLPQPRMAARFDQNSSLFYKAATGIYFQPPEPQETAKGVGNPDLESPYAIHFTTGFEKDFRKGSDQGFTLQTNLFYRHFEKLVARSTNTVIRDGAIELEQYNNQGKGKAYGAEFLIRFDRKPWSGWLSYTLSRSLRQEPGQSEYLFEYDQTHNINMVGAYEAKNNWRYSARLRYVTGNPQTPVVDSTLDADNDVYIPVRGPYFSERNSPFVQLDVRIDKTWVYDSWLLNVYLDIQNATNQKNSEGIRYSYNYAEKRNVDGLPIIPTFGIRGDF